jgi:hypothetical protein
MSLGPVVFPEVLVLHQTDMGWLCEIEERAVFVAQLQVEPGTTMPREGQRGPVTIAAFAVEDIRAAIRRAERRP